TRCPLWVTSGYFAVVRFTLKSGHVQCNSVCPLCANSGLMERSKRSLFDQLVGEREQIRGNSEA
ncbi:MAG: hypothetical protein WBA14_18000, partial [Pseudolabrys sp.]